MWRLNTCGAGAWNCTWNCREGQCVLILVKLTQVEHQCVGVT